MVWNRFFWVLHSPEPFESKCYNLRDTKNETNDQKNKLSIRFWNRHPRKKPLPEVSLPTAISQMHANLQPFGRDSCRPGRSGFLHPPGVISLFCERCSVTEDFQDIGSDNRWLVVYSFYFTHDCFLTQGPKFFRSSRHVQSLRLGLLFWVVINIEYHRNFQIWYLPNCWISQVLCGPF